MAQRIHLNTLLDTILMMLLDHNVIVCKTSTMTGYARTFDENATMSFKANNKQILKDYNNIWEKFETFLKIDFESKPVYGDDEKYIKTKIKIHAGSVISNFHNKKCLKKKHDASVYQ